MTHTDFQDPLGNQNKVEPFPSLAAEDYGVVLAPEEPSLADPRLEFLRPVPIAGAVIGGALICGYLIDLVVQLPGDAASVLWRAGFLEKVFDGASLMVLGIGVWLMSLWCADSLKGRKHRKLGAMLGLLSTALGLCLLLAVPLYSMDARIIFDYQSEQLRQEREQAHALPGTPLADRFDFAAHNMEQTLFKNVFRRDATAIFSGLVLLILGAQGVR